MTQNDTNFLSFVIGLILGAAMVMTGMAFDKSAPGQMEKALVPLSEFVGHEIGNADDLARALNVCITDGPLPEGCAGFVKNGVVTQPPIKIVLDLERLRSR